MDCIDILYEKVGDWYLETNHGDGFDDILVQNKDNNLNTDHRETLEFHNADSDIEVNQLNPRRINEMAVLTQNVDVMDDEYIDMDIDQKFHQEVVQDRMAAADSILQLQRPDTIFDNPESQDFVFQIPQPPNEYINHVEDLMKNDDKKRTMKKMMWKYNEEDHEEVL